MNTTFQMTFDPAVLASFLIGTVLPLLVGLVTKIQTHPGIKAILLALLSIASGFISQWIEAMQSGGQLPFWTALGTALITYVAAQTTHNGVWQNTGITGALQAIGSGPTPPKQP